MRSYSDGTHTISVDNNRVTVSVASAQLSVPTDFFMESSNMVQQQYYASNQQSFGFAPLAAVSIPGPGESPESSPTTTPSSE